MIWKDVVGFEGRYKVSNTGLVYSCFRALIILDKSTKVNTASSGNCGLTHHREMTVCEHPPAFSGTVGTKLKAGATSASIAGRRCPRATKYADIAGGSMDIDGISPRMLESGFYNMDCMDGMAQFPDKFFELAIVDPPYGIGNFIPQNMSKTGRKISSAVTWNDNTPSQDYFDSLCRVSRNQIIWGANYYNSFPKGGGALVWNKGDANPVFSQCEIASLSFQKRVDYVLINWQSGFHRENIEHVVHPCQKPISLYKWLLSKYAHPGDKILDTHVGSASSLIACHQMGFEYWGFELDADYYKAATERLNKVKAQVSITELIEPPQIDQIKIV